MFGYPTNDDYYHDASPVHTLKSVQVPMLCLNAADDVFSPSHGEPKTGLPMVNQCPLEEKPERTRSLETRVCDSSESLV